ncbi:MAG TPA: AI-2E family transporter [Bacteroidia bacterium]|nr:AI-2E family transporter [Bacteroidia bacterium]
MNNLSTAEGKDFFKVIRYIVYAGVILYFGRTILIPLSFSLLIAFLVYPVCAWLEKKKFSRMTASMTGVSLVVLFVAAMLTLLANLFLRFAGQWNDLKEKLFISLQNTVTYIGSSLSINEEQQAAWLKNVIDQSSSQFLPFLRTTIYESSVWLVLVILIPILSILILYYRRMLAEFLFLLFPSEPKEFIIDILHLSITSYYNFIKGMVIVYFVVGTLNSIGLALLGIPNAILFGFVVSIMTFIPYIGVIVASLLPITVSWLVYDSIWYPLGVVALFTFVQYLEANLIFPLAVSNRLKINALVALVVILLGGLLWGVSGMILFIPFAAILKLIADRTEKLKILSVLLGDGKFQQKNNP